MSLDSSASAALASCCLRNNQDCVVPILFNDCMLSNSSIQASEGGAISSASTRLTLTQFSVGPNSEVLRTSHAISSIA